MDRVIAFSETVKLIRNCSIQLVTEGLDMVTLPQRFS